MSLRNFSCLALLFLSLTSFAKEASFHLVTENFPPLNMPSNGSSHARNARVSGFATDIVRQLFKQNGYNAKFTLMSSWNKAFNRAKDNSGYGIYSTFRTPQREDKFQWVGPLYEEEWVILAPKSSNLSIESLEDLKAYTVGSYESDAISDYLREHQITIKTAKSDAVNVVKLKLGKIDLWASSSLTGPYVASNFNIPIKQLYKFNVSSLWLAMHKSTDPAVIAKLNQDLKEMHRKGEVQRLIDSYNQS